MKTLVGKIVSIAAVASTASLTASAAAPTLDNRVSRDLNHLTLLRGPNLTSPVVPMVAAKPETTVIAPPAPDPDTFRYVPTAPETGAVRKSGPGTLTLRRTDEPAAPSAAPAATQKKPLPDAESLRFDSKLHPTPTRSQIERVREPAPKRD